MFLFQMHNNMFFNENKISLTKCLIQCTTQDMEYQFSISMFITSHKTSSSQSNESDTVNHGALCWPLRYFVVQISYDAQKSIDNPEFLL